ncbi:MAG TPA: NAD-dependent epimerase/dehydratase family protein [Bryobacteraceae bacterium]|nr:NAD-dependent epimerase/dehydratase family protein [Bryobacteraceae bacterium]HPT26050.1 NAD-dependent epimerase/dehydratase family protein [Bryobacteraceae bacterium]
MKPALVTGASGFLGWHVARVLIDRGYQVRGLARRSGSIADPEIEEVAGDLRDADSLKRAVAGCGVVFHVAADYRLWAKDPAEMYRSNVEGTRNLLEATLRAGVDRIVYTSTVGCIGLVKGSLGDETTPVCLKDMTGSYKRSKFLAEREAIACAGRGLPVVIVNPTAPVGSHDVKPTPTGKTVLDFMRGRMPAYLDTGLNVVDARETAEGHWLACEKGRVGERYILGGENLTLNEIFRKLSAITGRPAPKVRIPWVVAYGAGVVSTGVANMTGTPPRAPLDAVRMARKKMWVSVEKARRELGFNASPAEKGLRNAVDWFNANGYN